MEIQFKKTSGICLLIGSALATLTMILHPLGGDLNEIARIKSMLMFSHSLAILCIPFIAFGFWGLSIALLTESKLSFLAFCTVCFGLIAGMMAGTFNGLVLPQFASASANSAVNPNVLQAIRGYGKFVNISMDYIFIIFIAISILIWSLVIIRTGMLSKWLGYYGILTVITIAICLLLKLNFTSVLGFTLFIFGIVSWKFLAGIILIRSAKKVKP